MKKDPAMKLKKAPAKMKKMSPAKKDEKGGGKELMNILAKKNNMF